MVGKGWGFTRRRVGAVAAAFALALLAGGLSACSEPDKPAPAPIVRLGTLMPLTGVTGPVGQRQLEAQQMAVKEANDAGGVLGYRVELVTGDVKCDPETAVEKANEMVGENITVSVGGSCSKATVPVLKVFRDAGIPMIIPAANSTDLLAPGYDSVFLLSGTTKIEAQRAVAAMGRLDTRRLAVVDDGTSFPETLAAATVAGVRQRGSTITLATQLKLSQGATSYPRIVQAVLSNRADMVFFTGYYAEAATLIRDLRAANYTGQILLSDAGTDPALFGLLSPAEAEGAYGLALPLAQFEPRAKAWAARYKAAYGKEPGPFTMQAYDAVRLALNAIQRAGSLDQSAIRKAIAATTPGDIQLLSGPPQFKPDGTQVNPTFMLLQARNGAFTLAPP
jgi:branched-chain amino acid transport system substrate-binding protein